MLFQPLTLWELATAAAGSEDIPRGPGWVGRLRRSLREDGGSLTCSLTGSSCCAGAARGATGGGLQSSGRAAGDGGAAARFPCILKAVPAGIASRLAAECARRSLVRDDADVFGLGPEGGAVTGKGGQWDSQV